VHKPFQAQPVTRDNPYLHFKPNREVVFSMGWNFAVVNKVRINNYGFVNDQDYDPERVFGSGTPHGRIEAGKGLR
jgi:hypothetical protein